MQYYPQAGTGNICRLFGKTRQAWYKQQKAADNGVLHQAIIINMVSELRQQMPRLGTRKLQHLLGDTLKQQGISIGRDKLFDLLAAYGLLVRKRKRRKVYTTDSDHPFYKYPNLTRYMIVEQPGQLWVSDITYIRVGDGFAYLSLITDAYSRKIVGYCLYPTLHAAGALTALRMALTGRDSNHSLIHHSDRGIQYCCNEYSSLLQGNGILISMTEKGDPYENAIAERVNGILKDEFGLDTIFTDMKDAQQVTDNAINIYNSQRPHASCNYLTPEHAHQQHGILPMKWKKTTKDRNAKRTLGYNFTNCQPETGLTNDTVN